MCFPFSRQTAILLLCFILGFGVLSRASAFRTYYVSPSGSDSNPGTSQTAPKLTLQAAVTASASGDTVIVGDGTYTGPGDVDVNFGARNITFQSQNGPIKTVIECGGSSSVNHHGLYLSNGLYGVGQSTIRGFTIKDGYSSEGGAILANLSNVTLTNCNLINNTAGFGGGASFLGGVIAVSNCNFTSNIAESSDDPSGYSGGGGLYIDAGETTLANCTFENNSSNSNGGGLLVTGIQNGAPPTGNISISDCKFVSNQASSSGGGIYSDRTTAIFVNCTCSSNVARLYGGGLCNSFSPVSFTGCTINSNAADNGGGLWNGGKAQLTDCSLADNTATTAGAAFDSSGSATLNYCTVTDNNTIGVSGGLYNTGTATLTNDIFWNDSGYEINGSGTVTATYCDVQGSYGNNSSYAGTGNINADPLFVNSPTDIHLRASSPCIGAGIAVTGVTTDLDGNTRSNPDRKSVV